MYRTLLKSKLHRVRVTEANVDYYGSVTIDRDLMDAANLVEFEKVDILDISNGARLSTYVIEGERATGEICINGAAARLVKPGDLVIIISYVLVAESELNKHQPHIVFVDENNVVTEKVRGSKTLVKKTGLTEGKR
jgi:aspartate 1-decarboxylase